MSFSSRLRATVKPAYIVIAAAVVLPLTSSCRAQELEDWKLFVTPPENVRTVWFLRARHVASELELDREAARELGRIYFSARREHSEKVEALPKTAEGFREFWQIGEEARSALEKSLVEALGNEKGQKAAVALGGFTFFTDNMAADMLAAQNKALGAVFKYEENVNNVMKGARESGSWEGVRDKFEELIMDLAEKVGAIFSEGQMNDWQEKYGPIVERILSM